MNLRKLRSAVSLLITLLLSAALSSAVGAVMINSTFASSSFMERRFVTESLADDCESQLDLQFEALALKSGIPARVFRNIEKETSVENTLRSSVHNFYNHIDTEAAKATKAEYFYNLCVEYLEGNNLTYNKQDIENTAYEAVEIYENCLGLSNTEHLIDFADGVQNDAPRAALGLLVSAFVLGAFFFVLYKSKNRALSYISTSVSVSGVTLTFISVISLIFKVGTHFAMTSAAHYNAMCSVIRLFYLLLFAVGALLILVGTVGNIIIYNSEKKKERK